MLYTHKGQYPTTLPSRIRLLDGSTRTAPFTDEFLLSIGYRAVSNPPPFGLEQKLEWTGTNWLVSDKSSQEIEQDWNKIRVERDQRIKDIEWRYMRYNRHERLGLPQIDSLEKLDAYVQALANITNQNSPYNVDWPKYEV